MVSMVDTGAGIAAAPGSGGNAAIVGGVGLLLESTAFPAGAARHLITMRNAPLLRQAALTLLICLGAAQVGDAGAQAQPAAKPPEAVQG